MSQAQLEFAREFTANASALWVLAAAWVGRADAEDLVQETARVAWQRRRTFRAGSDRRAWLAQIARHLGANWRRRRRPALLPDDQLPEPPDASAEPPWPIDADLHLSQELAQALAALPPVARACLLLHVVLELPFEQIAVMLQIPENTAMSHARRARLRLREALPAPKHRAPTP